MYYTYLWLREDGTPYYVGKGSGNRAFIKNKHRVLPPTDLSKIIVQEHSCEASAFNAEIFIIAYYGRKDLGTGCLRNLTDGGENPPKCNKTHCIRGHEKTPENKYKWGGCKDCVKINNKLSRPRHKERKNQKRRKFGARGSPELKIRTVQRAKEQWLNPEFRKKNHTNHKGE